MLSQSDKIKFLTKSSNYRPLENFPCSGCAAIAWGLNLSESITRVFFASMNPCAGESDNGEVPHSSDYGYGYALAIQKVCMCSESSARPIFSDHGYGSVQHVFDSQKHAAAPSVF